MTSKVMTSAAAALDAALTELTHVSLTYAQSLHSNEYVVERNRDGENVVSQHVALHRIQEGFAASHTAVRHSNDSSHGPCDSDALASTDAARATVHFINATRAAVGEDARWTHDETRRVHFQSQIQRERARRLVQRRDALVRHARHLQAQLQVHAWDVSWQNVDHLRAISARAAPRSASPTRGDNDATRTRSVLRRATEATPVDATTRDDGTNAPATTPLPQPTEQELQRLQRERDVLQGVVSDLIVSRIPHWNRHQGVASDGIVSHISHWNRHQGVASDFSNRVE